MIRNPVPRAHPENHEIILKPTNSQIFRVITYLFSIRILHPSPGGVPPCYSEISREIFDLGRRDRYFERGGELSFFFFLFVFYYNVRDLTCTKLIEYCSTSFSA